MKFVAASAMAERRWVVGFQVQSRKHQLARSVEVSVRAQKKGGLQIHPMGRTKGKDVGERPRLVLPQRRQKQRGSRNHQRCRP